MKNVSELIESNGKTIKENNLLKNHNIPIGTLVEFPSEDDKDILRAYIVDHIRDCDGEPLYRFSFDKEFAYSLQEDLKINKNKKSLFYMENIGVVFGAHPEECINVVSNKDLLVDLNQNIGSLINFKNQEGDILRAYLIEKENEFIFKVSSNKNVNEELKEQAYQRILKEEELEEGNLSSEEIQTLKIDIVAIKHIESLKRSSITRINVVN